MKFIPFLIALVAAGCLPINEAEPKPTPVWANDRYEDGVNNALRAFVLLNLEQELKGERRNFGEMVEIVCKRLGVKNTITK